MFSRTWKLIKTKDKLKWYQINNLLVFIFCCLECVLTMFFYYTQGNNNEQPASADDDHFPSVHSSN